MKRGKIPRLAKLIALLCAPTWKQLTNLTPWLALALLTSFAIQELKFFSYYCAFIITNSTFSFHDFFFTFAHPRFFNQYQIWTIPFLTAALLIKHPYLEKKNVRYFLWTVTIIWWLMFFTTNGRGAVVATIGSYILSYIVFRHKAKDFLKLTGILFITGFALYQVFFYLVPNLMGNDSFLAELLKLRMTSSGRTTYLWPKAIDYIFEKPWLGVGPLHYAWYPNKIAAHPHNSVLQIGAEWGIPALSICLFLLYRAVKAWIIKFNRHNLIEQNKNFNLVVIALSFSVSSALIYSLFSGVIIMPMSHLIGTLIVSFAIAAYHPPFFSIHTESNKLNWGLTVSFALLAITYFWLLSPELIPRLVDPAFHSTNFHDVKGPRFWLFGDISK